MEKDVIEKLVREVVDELAIPGKTNTSRPNPVRTSGECIPVSVSNRHLHISQEHLELLFGKGYQLQNLKDLSQPGQYAAKETVTIVGPKGAIPKVRILGPVRPATQVELSGTDTRTLGIKAPLRESGDIKGSFPITIVGPQGSVYLKEGAIRAWRHIHLKKADAAKYGLKDRDVVSVRIKGDRGGVMEHVIARVSDSYALDMHIDTDEGNAFGIEPGTMAEIV